MTSLAAALRRASSVTLAVSFVAMAISGVCMLLVDRVGSQLRLHPVHNVFGIVMVTAGLVHLVFNWKALLAYLRRRGSMVLGLLLAGAMALLFVAGLTRPLPDDVIQKLDEILSEARRAEHAG